MVKIWKSIIYNKLKSWKNWTWNQERWYIKSISKKDLDYEIDVKETEYKGHIEDLIDEFSKENYSDKYVIICGGDGSLHELVNACYDQNISIGLIPTGTGNDFSKNFDYRDFHVEDAFDFYTRPIDLLKINNKICINVTSLGFDTHVLEEAYRILEKYPDFGKRAYIQAVLNSLKILAMKLSKST